MQCNSKKCKQCGMWWKIESTDEHGKPIVQEMCGHLAIYFRLNNIQQQLIHLRVDTQDRGNEAIKGLVSIIETNKHLKRIG